LTEFQALILGLVQGLTEFLPVSSSGHLEMGHYLFDIHGNDNLLFALVVHSATVLSTLVVFRDDILNLIKALFRFEWNQQTQYISKLLVSALPVILVGLLFKGFIESFFDGKVVFVGSMLLLTAILLTVSSLVKKREKPISYVRAIIIGIAQAVAVLPGLSRSGATIATGLIVGVKKDDMAKFSFLMVLLPIIGALGYDILKGDLGSGSSLKMVPLIIGFLAAFISGLVACKWMVKIVRKGNLIYFAIYCFIIGLIAIFAA
jgi:undecaprenyl-diphosphatase